MKIETQADLCTYRDRLIEAVESTRAVAVLCGMWLTPSTSHGNRLEQEGADIRATLVGLRREFQAANDLPDEVPEEVFRSLTDLLSDGKNLPQLVSGKPSGSSGQFNVSIANRLRLVAMDFLRATAAEAGTSFAVEVPEFDDPHSPSIADRVQVGVDVALVQELLPDVLRAMDSLLTGRIWEVDDDSFVPPSEATLASLFAGLQGNVRLELNTARSLFPASPASSREPVNLIVETPPPGHGGELDSDRPLNPARWFTDDLLTAAKVDSTTLNRWVRSAEVIPTDQGDRNRKFTDEEVQRIADAAAKLNSRKAKAASRQLQALISKPA
ncbi:hypothetical protein [Rubinisphaera margarita]|uniref:hypothetical protein n=1 Tax=Rubinisphaera margarita TaxID=2909586 RepID=UPI001EE783A6|nr:hypothetical protein [Rubinisphaera margarita]MCG6157099.1 hypothetical protein [Rubinisphaera margarita]